MEQSKENSPKTFSSDIGIDYPLTNPAQKAHNDRLDHEAKGGYAKPEPTDLNTEESLLAKNNPKTQTPAEFEKSGGQSVMDDNSEITPETGGTDKAKK